MRFERAEQRLVIPLDAQIVCQPAAFFARFDIERIADALRQIVKRVSG